MRLAMTLVLLLAGSAHAQKTPHKEGEYGGVMPGQTGKADPGAKAKPKRLPPRGTLSWIGFEAKDGGAQIFFQSVGPFNLSQRVEGATLIVSLDLTKLGGNTWRAVDTRFFDNPLSSITATKPRGKTRSVDVKIKFKNPKDARQGTMRSGNEADGMYYVYLTFPEGADGSSKPATDAEN